MKKRALLIVLVIAIVTLAIPVWAANPPIPSPDSSFYILDQANVLDSGTEQAIFRTSVALEQQTKAQIVVVMVNSLEGSVPEDYALTLLREWAIGDKKLNNGALILLSLEERLSRIEVGYGLEGALPDGKTGRIQDEYMIPYFKQNDFQQGIINGYRALVQEVAAEYKVPIEINSPQKLPASTSPTTPLPDWAMVTAVILALLLFYLDYRYLDGFFLGLILGMLMRGSGGYGGGFGGRGGSGGGGGSSREW